MTPYASIGKLFPVDPAQEEIRDPALSYGFLLDFYMQRKA